MNFSLKYRNRKGEMVGYNVDHTVYRKAAEAGMNLRQFVKASVAHDCDFNAGDPLDQMLTNSGLVGADQMGMPAQSMKDLMTSQINADGLRAPDGSDTSLGARLLYPQLILETMAQELSEDNAAILNQFSQMVALTRNVTGDKLDQPLINTKPAEDADSEHTAQLAAPPTMVTITTGDVSYRIPQQSIGLTISDQAMEATTIDLVRIVMQTQSRAERIRMIERQLRGMIFGDSDRNMTALPVSKVTAFDSSITTANTITKRAWIKWLRENYRTMDITDAMLTLDTALDVDEGLRPTVTGTDGSKIATPFAGLDLGVQNPSMMDLQNDILSRGLVVGLDRKHAIQRFINVSASYDGIEDFVLRRAKAFRVDTGEMSVRLYDEAWSVLSLTV